MEVVGPTVIETPVPSGVPPHEPEYQCQLAPVPNVPPATVRVVVCPLQIVAVPLMPVGATDGWFTVTN